MIQARIPDSVSIELRVPRWLREKLSDLAHAQHISINKLLLDLLLEHIKEGEE